MFCQNNNLKKQIISILKILDYFLNVYTNPWFIKLFKFKICKVCLNDIKHMFFMIFIAKRFSGFNSLNERFPYLSIRF